MPVAFGASSFLFSDNGGIYSESSAFSVGLWVNRAGTTSTQTFYGEASRANTTTIFSLQTGPTSGKASVFLRNSSNVIGILNVATASTVFDSTWHHFGYAQDASGNWQVYVDGVADSNCHGAFTPGSFTAPGLGIGCLRQNPTTQVFNGGAAAHAATWSRQLSAKEFVSLAAGLPPSILGPTHYWPLWIVESPIADIGSTRLASAIAAGGTPTTPAGGPRVGLSLLQWRGNAPFAPPKSTVTVSPSAGVVSFVAAGPTLKYQSNPSGAVINFAAGSPFFTSATGGSATTVIVTETVNAGGGVVREPLIVVETDEELAAALAALNARRRRINVTTGRKPGRD